jgi:hypothetical protein
MAITVNESVDSREFTDGKSATLTYIIQGTDSEDSAMSELKTEAPATFQSMARQSTSVEPVYIEEGNSDRCVWKGTARYAYVAIQTTPPATGDSLLSFDTGGGTQHITQSLQTISKNAPPDETAPDFNGAIGVTQDSVEGVDITVPIYHFSQTHYLPAENVNNTYIGTLFRLTGKVNNGDFKGLNAGEGLFLGASGSKRGDADWEITFRFAGSPSRTGIVIGDIEPFDKDGWDYMWVLYEDAEDTAANTIVKRPVAAYVEKVYERANYADLGIGT